MTQCFYCGHDLQRTNRKALHYRTQDHVYPLSMVFADNEFWRRVKSSGLNKVECCAQCNSYKGRLSPLDWLVIMPDGERAAALAQRMIKMGEDMAEVFSALRRRKK